MSEFAREVHPIHQHRLVCRGVQDEVSHGILSDLDIARGRKREEEEREKEGEEDEEDETCHVCCVEKNGPASFLERAK